MDKLNRLTRNSEWQVGARYRYRMGRERQGAHVAPPVEVTFLGWLDGGRLVGVAELLHADGKKVSCTPYVWKNRYVCIAPPPPDTASSQQPNAKTLEKVC